MHPDELTASNQDYLKVIWTSREWRDEPISSRALAQRLGQSPSTVSETVKKLTQQGLLTHERYGDVELTESGRRAALAMVRRHRLIETFLVDYLGYGWDEVHDEAEVLEHAVSDLFMERLATALGDPSRDPHGDPIPTATGDLPDLNARQLSTVEGGRVRVARVSDADPELLRFLTDQGIGLDVILDVHERHEFAGTMKVSVSGVERDLGLPAAEAIWVSEL
ncbi:metal-dependent transcriptional regulator [Aeromicrobium phragmitis]|uniref:metal-dependent transcriptional regulator n=1 Tax=Aeromicrobium phragmitis TaxID=2478914 RepID=UPI001FB6760F|nr:metal-dependent transcriptional regulator [Aeromicrobium phragmitis]